MAARRLALIIANDTYEHEGLSRLRAPAADAEALAGVLGDAQVGGFDVQTVHNAPAHAIANHIEDLFSDRHPEDVVLLHFSGHGLKSESGELFFAAANTRPNRLQSTAVSADLVQRCMRACRSRSVVLLLDCCYGGAFGRGVTVRASSDANVLHSFTGMPTGGGRGRAVITASSAMEYAFEEGRLADDQSQQPSVFTAAVVEGLATGAADRDEDGWVSLNELYDYVFDRVRERNPHQTPSRDVQMQGELYLARSGRRKVMAAPVPPDVRAAMQDANMFARLGAVTELSSRLAGPDLPAALGAYEALVSVEHADIRVVAEAARAALAAARAQPSERALHFGQVSAGSDPHLFLRFAGLPLARAWRVAAAPSWLRAEPVDDGFDVSLVAGHPGDLRGDLLLRAPTGDLVVPVEAVVLAPVAPEPVIAEPVVAEPVVVEEVDSARFGGVDRVRGLDRVRGGGLALEPVGPGPVVSEPVIATFVSADAPAVSETVVSDPAVHEAEVPEPEVSSPAEPEARARGSLEAPDPLVEERRVQRLDELCERAKPPTVSRASVARRSATALRSLRWTAPSRSPGAGSAPASFAGAAIVMGGLTVFLAAPMRWIYPQLEDVGAALVVLHLAAYGAFRLWQAWTWRRASRPAAVLQALVGVMALVAAVALVTTLEPRYFWNLEQAVGWFWVVSGATGTVAAYVYPAGPVRVLEMCIGVLATASGLVALQMREQNYINGSGGFLIVWSLGLGALLVAVGVLQQQSGATESVAPAKPREAPSPILDLAVGVLVLAALVTVYVQHRSIRTTYDLFGAALVAYGASRLHQSYTARDDRRSPWLALLGVVFPVAGGLYIACGEMGYPLPVVYVFVTLSTLGGAAQLVVARLSERGLSQTSDNVTGGLGILAGPVVYELFAASDSDPNGYVAGLWVATLGAALVVLGVERFRTARL